MRLPSLGKTGHGWIPDLSPGRRSGARGSTPRKRSSKRRPSASVCAAASRSARAAWVGQTVQSFGLESTLRQPGRPRRPAPDRIHRKRHCHGHRREASLGPRRPIPGQLRAQGVGILRPQPRPHHSCVLPSTLAAICTATSCAPNGFAHEPDQVKKPRRRPRGGLHSCVDGRGDARPREGRDRAH